MEKKPTHRRFKDPNSLISTEDIDACTSLDTLVNWKTTIDGNIADADMQIGIAKGKSASEGVFMDPEKYQKLIGYRKILGFLSQKIQFRQRELKHNNKGVSDIFMDCARTMLAKDIFDRIFKMAIEIKSSHP